MAGQPGHACPYLVAAGAAELVRPVFAINSQVSFGWFEFAVVVDHND